MHNIYVIMYGQGKFFEVSERMAREEDEFSTYNYHAGDCYNPHLHALCHAIDYFEEHRRHEDSAIAITQVKGHELHYWKSWIIRDDSVGFAEEYVEEIGMEEYEVLRENQIQEWEKERAWEREIEEEYQRQKEAERQSELAAQHADEDLEASKEEYENEKEQLYQPL